MTSKPDTQLAPPVVTSPGVMTPGVMMTVAEFCKKYRMGRTKYQEMKRRHETPEELCIGNRILISNEAEAQWLAAVVERTRRLNEDRFAVHAPAPSMPPRPPARTFPSGKKIGRPRKVV